MYPNLCYEKKLWSQGFDIVAGLDEVGRGSFAGPLIAGCVVFSPGVQVQTLSEKVVINDSKLLTAKQREASSFWIKENALGWGIGEVSVAEINRKGIAKATASAFRRAVADANIGLLESIDYLLIDAFYVPYYRDYPIRSKKTGKKDIRERQLAILKGDRKSLSISAASIIAKVYRDWLMVKLSNRPELNRYGWDSNKGYGTEKHRNAISKHGVTRQHRRKFVEKYLLNSLSVT